MKAAESQPSETAAPLVFLVAGEPSGDALGGRLMAALRELAGGKVRFAGVGGPRMEEQGLESRFPMAELSVMGLAEVVPHLPRLLRRLVQTVADIRARRPAAVVTIDSPGFNFRLARRLEGDDILLIHYVAPTVWAWKPGRAKRIAVFLDHLMAMLPFEPPYFEAEGLACTFVGHPVLESGADKGAGAEFRQRYRIHPEAPLLCVLPGSRRGETARLLPVFGHALALLGSDRPDLVAVVPTMPGVADEVATAAGSWPVRSVVLRDEAEKYDAFAAADAALAASGTVALELAMAGTPMVVAYRVNPLSAWLARRLIRVRFVNLVNIILDRDAVPELLQEDCRAERLAAAVGNLLDDEDARRTQTEAAGRALDHLGRDGPPPSRRAARLVLDLIADGQGSQLARR